MSEIDRETWRRQRRLWNEVQMDTIYARQYDAHWGASINDTHQRMIDRFLDRRPPNARILDAASGTGKYWSLLLERSCSVVGTDQSAQMLASAHEKHPAVAVEHVGVQELSFDAVFDGVICMDAMENVFHEDWPLVLGHFARALHAGGWLYCTRRGGSRGGAARRLRSGMEAGPAAGLW